MDFISFANLIKNLPPAQRETSWLVHPDIVEDLRKIGEFHQLMRESRLRMVRRMRECGMGVNRIGRALRTAWDRVAPSYRKRVGLDF